jgi:pimeloyl-ACP methyl ester carboxylesterase
VFLLPGILGSNLKVGGKRIWLGWRLINGLKKLDYTGRPDSVEPDGPVGMSYDDLAEFLSKTHEVIEFAFDWRRPLEEEAQRLASAVEAALDARAASGKPVRLIAHSMGGVLARTMQLERPAVWQRMMAHPDARLLMLGTPNGGSWAPMQVLSGDDTFGNLLVAFGAPFQDRSARALMARMPGFIQLQAALLDDKHKLDQHATWQSLAARARGELVASQRDADRGICVGRSAAAGA